MVDIVAQSPQDTVAYGTEEEKPQIARQIIKQNADKVATGESEETGPQTHTLLETVDMPHRPVG